jgi:hypothetical protein
MSKESEKYILDLSKMTLNDKKLVVKTTVNDILYNVNKIFSMYDDTDKKKYESSSPQKYFINFDLLNEFKEILSPFFKQMVKNEDSDINIIKINDSDIILSKYNDNDIGYEKNPNIDYSKPLYELYNKNIKGNKPFMNIIIVSTNSDIKIQFLQNVSNIVIFLYISDDFETKKLKVINNKKNLYKIFENSLLTAEITDDNNIEYKLLDLKNTDSSKCPKCKKCPKSKNCTDVKNYIYGLYGCGFVIIILIIFIFYILIKNKSKYI